MLMPKEMENVYLFFTWIISGEDNAFSGETALTLGHSLANEMVKNAKKECAGGVAFV